MSCSAPKISGRARKRCWRSTGAGFDYLFNSLKWWDFESPWLLEQYEKFRHIAPSIAFPESHDTERLVTELLAAGFPEDQIEARYRQAYALSAAFSTGVMMPMGFEFGWSRRISVVPNGHEDEKEPKRFDLQPFIAAVNRMKASVPALNQEGPQRRLSPPDDPLLVLLRQTERGNDRALILVNTQEREARDVVVQGLLAAAGLDRIDEQSVLTDALAEGGARPVLARFRVAPLDVRVLHAAPRPVRHVPVAPCPDVGRDPGHRPEWRFDARILIEDVWPEIDAGRYPIKRVVGDEVTVWADIFRDGHDKIRAVLKYALREARTGARRRFRFSTMTAGWRISGRTGSGAGAIRSRPGPIISKAGAPIWSRNRRPGRRSRSNSSRASGSSRMRSSTPTGADRRGCARSRRNSARPRRRGGRR